MFASNASFNSKRPNPVSPAISGALVHVSFLCFLASSLVLPTACSSHRQQPAAAPEPQAPLVWPAAPEQPRIAYLQSVYRPADIGIKQSAFTRFGRWLTGSDKGNEALIKPFGIALDENDNLCLTDTGANAVCFYDRARKKWQRWEKIGRYRFVSPVAIARRAGVFYVADSGLGRVLAFKEDGKLLLEIHQHLARPSGLTLLNDQLVVADAQRHCLVVFDLEGNFRSEIGRRGLGAGQFNFPTHVAVDPSGRMLVTDSMNHRVQILEPDGKFKAQVGTLGDSPGQFSRPKGVAADSLGHVYVLDALLDSLQVFDQTGQLLLTLGQTGAEAGQFWLPNGIAISHNNEIYVADSYNHRVQILKYVGPS